MEHYLKRYVPDALKTLKSSGRLGGLGKKLTLVLGNESGDLDSVVSSVVLSWAKQEWATTNNDTASLFLPCLNFIRSDLDLKTEVKYVFGPKLMNLPLENVPCIDELAEFGEIDEVVLVDHNVIDDPNLKFLDEKVKEIYDHHDVGRKNPDSLRVFDVRKVGSCSTIVAEKTFQLFPVIEDSHFLNLVRLSILVDTKNLCPHTNKATQLDKDILQKVEEQMQNRNNFPILEREEVLKNIFNSKSDIHHFSQEMMIRKDMKVIHMDSNRKASISTIPGVSCGELKIRNDGFEYQLNEFIRKFEFEISILLGNGDMAVYPCSDKLSLKIKSFLGGPKGEDLGIFHKHQSNGCDFYSRTKSSVSRKQILPAIETAINS